MVAWCAAAHAKHATASRCEHSPTSQVSPLICHTRSHASRCISCHMSSAISHVGHGLSFLTSHQGQCPLTSPEGRSQPHVRWWSRRASEIENNIDVKMTFRHRSAGAEESSQLSQFFSWPHTGVTASAGTTALTAPSRLVLLRRCAKASSSTPM